MTTDMSLHKQTVFNYKSQECSAQMQFQQEATTQIRLLYARGHFPRGGPSLNPPQPASLSLSDVASCAAALRSAPTGVRALRLTRWR